MDQINWDSVNEPSRSALHAPPSFLCPITNKVMFDPVVDKRGISYERSTVEAQYCPTKTRNLFPNTSLMELIHEFMGPAWVQQRQDELTDFNNDDESLPSQQQQDRPRLHTCYYRQQIEFLLGHVDLGVTLDERTGRGSFVHDMMQVRLHVPEGQDLLQLIVFRLVSGEHMNSHTREKMLHLNYSLGDSASLKLCNNSNCDQVVMFSMEMAVSSIGQNVESFKTILEDFCAKAFRMRVELWEEGRKVGSAAEGEKYGRRTSPSCVGQLR